MPAKRGTTGTLGHAVSAVNDGAVLAGAALAPLAPGMPGDASASSTWLSDLHASLQQQLADSLAASEAAAQTRLAAQAAQQQPTQLSEGDSSSSESVTGAFPRLPTGVVCLSARVGG